MKKLSELEASVLGDVWKNGPCTAYAVRKRFLESPTAHFSGSAGAIYPLVTRLESLGLLRSRAVVRGRRMSRAIEITRAGVIALKRWLGPPPLGAESATYDPLRTQMLFLGLLAADGRRRWLAETERALVAQLDRLQEHRESSGDPADRYFEIASWNALGQAKARIEWIREAARTLAGE